MPTHQRSLSLFPLILRKPKGLRQLRERDSENGRQGGTHAFLSSAFGSPILTGGPAGSDSAGAVFPDSDWVFSSTNA